MGTQRTTIPSVLKVPGYYNEIPKSQDYLDPMNKSCFPRHLKSKRNSRGIPETPAATQENTSKHRIL